MKIEIMLADEKRRLVKIEKAKRAIEKEKKRKKEEKFAEKLVHEWTEVILYSLKKGIEDKGNLSRFRYYLGYDIYYTPEFFTSQREATNNILNKCLSIISEILKECGYFVSIDEYDGNCQIKSSEFGYIEITW